MEFSEFYDGSMDSLGVYADYLEDNGEDFRAESWRINFTIGEEMEVGKNYLVHCGDWHTFVGRLVRQCTPMLYEFEQVSKIRDTNNGDNWHQLALGEDLSLRDAAEYVHSDTPCFMPIAIIAQEWVGELPSRG